MFPRIRIATIAGAARRAALTLAALALLAAGVARADTPRAASDAVPPDETQALTGGFVDLIGAGGAASMGYSVSGAGDVDGDGFSDVLVSSMGTASGGGYAAFLYRGSAAGPVLAWQKLDFPQAVKVSTAGDLNGDGFDDVAIAYGITGGVRVEVRYGFAGGLQASADFTDDVLLPPFAFAIETAGDVNGDGYDELLVGIASVPAGNVAVYMGSASGVSLGTRRLLGAPPTGGSRFGESLAGLGDINGDGYADIGVGGPDGGQYANGIVAIYFGSATGLPAGSPAATSQFFDPFDYHATNVEYGGCVAPAGDFNGDGYADIYIASPGYLDAIGVFSGIFEIDRGSPTGIGSVLYSNGGSGSERLGSSSFTAGDVNGDGYADVMVNSSGEWTGGGKLQLYEGGTSPYAVATTIGTFTSNGTLVVKAAGDVNGDGFGDIVLGAPENVGGSPNGGTARVYYGAADKMATVPADARWSGEEAALSGRAVATGDVSGDGYDDVLAGKPLSSSMGYTNNGGADLYLGGSAGISATPVWHDPGTESDGGNAGISVAMGQDIDGDGIGDVVVGAHVAGQVRVWFGSSGWNSGRSEPDQIVTEPNANEAALFGQSVSFAGDVNGDGYADVVVGEPQAYGLSRGGAWLFFGSPLGLVNGTPVPNTLEDGARFGEAVAGVGDLNADGYCDIVVGAPGHVESGVHVGQVWVYLGSSSGLGTAPVQEYHPPAAYVGSFGSAVSAAGDFFRNGYGDFLAGGYDAAGHGLVLLFAGTAYAPFSGALILEGDEVNGAFGCSVASAGDINGDGYTDIAVGQEFSDPTSGTDAGRVHVYLGPTGVEHAVLTGPHAFANFGTSLGGGDVNGDGFSDVVVGTPRHQNALYAEGSVMTYLGNSKRLPIGAPQRGRMRPGQLMKGADLITPLATYGVEPYADHTLVHATLGSAAGRDRVQLEWSIDPAAGSSGSSHAHGPWTSMGLPTAPDAGQVPAFAVASGLQPTSTYAWKIRTRSHSPYFRYGRWFTTQVNGRRQWDFRTGVVAEDVPLAGHAGEAVRLSSPWPNPARDGVRVRLALARRDRVRWDGSDVAGRRVASHEAGELAAGEHAIAWDTRDASGARCAPGLYFLEVQAGHEKRSTRIVLVR